MKKVILTTMLLAVFPHLYAQTQDDTTGRQFMAETPDAIVCIYNNPQKTRFVYRKTAGAKSDRVRYDGPEGYLLHYYLPSGALMTNANPQPSTVDCVYNSMSLAQLIQAERAYKYLTPMQSNGFLKVN